MTNMLYTAWLFLSEYNLRLQKYDVAYGIVNNSIIQLEKSDFSNPFLLLLFKYNMFKSLMYLQELDKAKLCIEQAIHLAQKKGINFEFDLEASHYVVPDENASPEREQEQSEDEAISPQNADAETVKNTQN